MSRLATPERIVQEFIPRRAEADLDLLLVFNVMRTHSILSPFVDNQLREVKLWNAQFNALLVLMSAGKEGLPLSEIGRRLVVTNANVTGLIDRLEKEKLVRRDSHRDRRVTLAKLTRKGIKLLNHVLPRHQKWLNELVDCLSKREKEQLIKLMVKLRRGLRERLNRKKKNV